MNYYPKDIYQKLEFDKILDLLKKECMGPIAIELIEDLSPCIELEVINTQLNNTWEYVASFERNDAIPLGNYESINETVSLLRKEGYVLDVESIGQIYLIVSIANQLKSYFDSLQRRKLSPGIYKIVDDGIQLDADINAEIERVFDETGEVRPTASDALLKIYKRISSREKEIMSVYGKVIHQYKTKGLLSDTEESMRNGRRVLAVPAENKRRISGVIHDESATGKTVYIEPSDAIPLNNEIQNLYTEKKKEVYKVLKGLCDLLRPHADSILALEKTIGHLDLLRAKAVLARLLEAHKPQIVESPVFSFRHAYNPILKIKYEAEEREVVPFDLVLHNNNRILVVSGPNAGGKSVLMKSVGLLQLMLQCGLLIPVDPNSKFGVFRQFFVDIGDQQSMEDDLSTYSSHLQNMKYFSEHADERTLVLIDEFGSGTDPKIGGAIAESILRKLNRQKVFGVMTTHYSNLKYYAFKTRGIVNAAMEFDQEALRPTFHLKVGKPGSSFAYEIASKTGLAKDIISYAKHKTGKNEKAIDELLVKLQSEKKETEDKMAKMLEKEDRLNKLIKNYEQLHKELEYRRKKLKLTAKEQALMQLSDDNKKLQQVVKEIRESAKLEEAKSLAENYKNKKKETIEDIKELKEEIYYKDKEEYHFNVGEFAKMRTSNSSGEILSIKKGVAEIQLGMMKVKVPLRELVPAKEPVELKSKSINTQMQTTREGVKTKLDVRGYQKVDAVKLVEEFMDTALVFNVSNLTILHGKGNGVLRKAVHKKLKEYKDIKKISHPEEEYGGEGITFVKL